MGTYIAVAEASLQQAQVPLAVSLRRCFDSAPSSVLESTTATISLDRAVHIIREEIRLSRKRRRVPSDNRAPCALSATLTVTLDLSEPIKCANLYSHHLLEIQFR
eukprot:IDg23133t1